MTYRNLQTRLLNISQLSPQSGLMVGTYTNLSHIIPLDIIVGRVSVSQTGISLDIIAHTTASLANFITALQADHDIASISIDKLINKTSDGTLSVTVTLALANQGAPTP